VNALRAKIQAMTVRASRAGRIVYKTDWQGAKKKIGDRVWRLDVVLQIPDLQSLRARGEVDEAQSGRVDVGQPVSFRLDAHPDRAYDGRVANVDRVVRPRSFRNPRNVVAVVVDLDRIDVDQMRPGMRIQGAIEVERRARVVAAPLAALGFDGEGPFVVASGRGRDKRRPALGTRNASWVEVLDGLEPGDRLLAPTAGDDSD
jgi:HlyD family secretion protein